MAFSALIVKLVIGWAGLACAFTLLTLCGTFVALRRARRVAAPARWPVIAIVRPCEGGEAGLEESLLSSATAAYGGPREVWCLVPDEADSAWAAAERATARAAELAPSVRMRVLATRITSRANRKAAQLATCASELSPDVEVIVQADSDVRLDDRALPALISALMADPAIAAASAPPVETRDASAPSTVADRLSATVLSSSLQSFIALAGLAAATGGTALVGGALTALRRDALALLDDWHALEPFLGEDFELNRRLLSAGRRVATAGECARCVEGGRSLGEVLRRFARWTLVLKRQRPPLYATYFLLVGCTPILVASATALTLLRAPAASLALAASAALVVTRTLLAMLIRRAARLPWNPLSSLASSFLAEVLVLTAAAMALGSSRIVWRGRRYRVGKGGRLEAL